MLHVRSNCCHMTSLDGGPASGRLDEYSLIKKETVIIVSKIHMQCRLAGCTKQEQPKINLECGLSMSCRGVQRCSCFEVPKTV